jgi:hypothetical protein
VQHNHSDGTAELIVGWSPSAVPVFVDTTGRRGRRLRIAAGLAGACVLAYTVVLGLAIVGRQVEPLSFVSVPDSAQTAVNYAEPAQLTVVAAPRREGDAQIQPIADRSGGSQNRSTAGAK